LTMSSSVITINAVPLPPSVPTASSTIQPTCGTPSGTIVFSTQTAVGIVWMVQRISPRIRSQGWLQMTIHCMLEIRPMLHV
jgi:hypothetical protein